MKLSLDEKAALLVLRSLEQEFAELPRPLVGDQVDVWCKKLGDAQVRYRMAMRVRQAVERGEHDAHAERALYQYAEAPSASYCCGCECRSPRR